MFFVTQWDTDEDGSFAVRSFEVETIEEAEKESLEFPCDCFMVEDAWGDHVGDCFKGKFNKAPLLTPR